MEYLFRVTALAITMALFSLVIRKNNPELSLLLGIAMAVMCLFGLADLVNELIEKIRQWQFSGLMAADYYVPLLKCLGISLVSQFGAGVCKDAGQTAASIGVELCGSVASAYCLIPLIEHLFKLFEDML